MKSKIQGLSPKAANAVIAYYQYTKGIDEGEAIQEILWDVEEKCQEIEDAYDFLFDIEVFYEQNDLADYEEVFSEKRPSDAPTLDERLDWTAVAKHLKRLNKRLTD